MSIIKTTFDVARQKLTSFFATVTATCSSTSPRDALVCGTPELLFALACSKFRLQPSRSEKLSSSHLRHHLDIPSNLFRLPTSWLQLFCSCNSRSSPSIRSTPRQGSTGLGIPLAAISASPGSALASSSSTVSSLLGNVAFRFFRALMWARPSSLPSSHSTHSLSASF